MLIVAGAFEIDPADRDAFIDGRLDSIRTTRTERGCLEYAMSADPVDPGRVLLFELWEDQSAFDAHLEAMKTGPRPTGPAPKGVSAKIYEISGERSFG